jgi:tetratricopeptide (TPR) repeat protein
MKKIIATVAVLMFLLALSAPLTFAQDTSAKPAAQDAAAEEAAAYKAWYDANNAKNFPKAMELAKAYLEKYPNGQYAAYLKDKWIPGARKVLLSEAVTAKNLPEIDRLGKEIMASDPENLDFALFLASQLRTLDTNFQYAPDTVQFTQTAIRLIDAGKTPAPTNPPKPFMKTETLGYLHDTLASIDEHDKNTDKALEHYEHAATIDAGNARYFFNCGRLHQTRYADAAKAYQALPEADRTAPEPKPEVKAALDKVNQEADGVINCWARFMGLPKNDYPPDVKQKVQTALTDLYKYRNNGSDTGLQKLIDDNKASPTPVKMTPPVEKPTTTAEQKPADQSAAKPGSGQPAAAAKPVTKKPRM